MFIKSDSSEAIKAFMAAGGKVKKVEEGTAEMIKQSTKQYWREVRHFNETGENPAERKAAQIKAAEELVAKAEAELAAIRAANMPRSEKLTSEFTKEDWKAEREDFIKDWMMETGAQRDVASVMWEDYCGQEGWTGRDMRIMAKRDHKP